MTRYATDLQRLQPSIEAQPWDHPDERRGGGVGRGRQPKGRMARRGPSRRFHDPASPRLSGYASMIQPGRSWRIAETEPDVRRGAGGSASRHGVRKTGVRNGSFLSEILDGKMKIGGTARFKSGSQNCRKQTLLLLGALLSRWFGHLSSAKSTVNAPGFYGTKIPQHAGQGGNASVPAVVDDDHGLNRLQAWRGDGCTQYADMKINRICGNEIQNCQIMSVFGLRMSMTGKTQ